MMRCTVMLTTTALLACSGASKNEDTTASTTSTGTDGTDTTDTTPAGSSDKWTMADGPMADSAIGLSKTSVFDTPDPEWYVYPTTEPGENKLLPRAFIGAPPLIPHQVDDYLPITHDENTCYACHQTSTTEPGGPTPIPPSHFIDYRAKATEPGPEVYAARWRCMACHVVQSNAPPLVGDNFNPTP